MIIGITGGSGSGKTTLLDMLKDRGALVLDCAAVYHGLLKTDREMLSAIEARFPGTVEDGALQRKKLGAVVFADPQALLDLNAITHAAVKKEVLRQLETAPKHCAIDAIGLYEGGLAQLCDVTVAVTAPREARIRRLMARDGITREYAQKRLDAQHPDEWFRERCAVTLENDGDIDAFATKCVAFLRRFSIIE